jgi:hypothetical protein
MVFDRSNGIYRSIIFAVAGLILIGASGKPTPRAYTKQAQADQPVTSKADNTNPIAPKTDIPESKDYGCKQGHDDRQSDLCAQWKAADAATDAARSSDTQTFIGWIGLLLGGITMGAAIAAAIYAKKAAEHTKTGADAATTAHESFVSSERGRISFYHANISTNADGFDDYCLELRVHNIGKALAIIESISWSVSMPIFPEKTQRQMFKTIPIAATEGDATIENSKPLTNLGVNLSVDDLWHNKIYAMGFVDYKSVERNFRSHFCFQINFIKSDGYVDQHWDCSQGLCSDRPEDT